MTGAHVLVVDDNRDMADGIAMLLGEAELQARVAYSGRRALSLMEEQPFELVLSDIRMPTMSGLELLENIRSRWPRTKVVLLTAHGTIESAVDAMKVGACDYLTKPFDNDELVNVVRRTLAVDLPASGPDVAGIVGEIASLVSADNLLPSLRSVLEVLLRATGADDAEIFLCEPEGQDPVLSAWAGPDGEALADRPRFSMGEGYPGIVIGTGQSLSMQGGLADDPRFLRRAVVDAGMRSLVAAPLSDAKTALGSLHVLSRRADFPVERARELLERAAVPISNAVRAGLAALRQSVDALSGNLADDESGRSLRSLLESMRELAGARDGTLAIVDPRTGVPRRVVSTGPASLACSAAEGGAWTKCPSVVGAHGFLGDPSRRQWPAPCRRGLPRRATSPCCLPLVTGGHMHGIVVLDFGREGGNDAGAHMVPLLTMAHQAAIRLQSHQAGLAIALDGATEVMPPRATPELEVLCFGPFTVRRNGVAISAGAFTRSKALVLLKLLALKMGAPVNREVLIEQLWPEVEPQLGANRLHGVVHDLRSVIEPQRAGREWLYVRNRGDLYYLDVSAPIDIDVTRFRLLLAQGLRASPEHETESIAWLEQAAALYRGDLFEDDPFADWCAAERDELKEGHLKALERLAQLHGKRGTKEEALSCLRRASRTAPFRDDLMQAQLELLAQLARPSEALTAYDAYVRALKDELGADPSAALQALHRRLLKAVG